MSDITIADLTNKTVDEPGTGVFDLLMASNKLQLEEQWEDGKLTGAEYATVYLGAMQSTLQHSIQFLLSEQEADKKADLVSAQAAEVLANTLRTDATALLNDALILEKTESENKQNELDGLIDQQIKDSIAGIALKAAQEAEVIADTLRSDATALLNDALILEKTESEDKQNITGGILDKQLADVIAGTTVKTSQNLEILADTARSDLESTAKINLMVEQTESEDLQNKTDGLIENQIIKMQEDAKLAKSQADKSYAEMLASIDKEYGFNYTLDANDELVRSSLADAGDGKLDAEILSMEKEGELKTAQILTETQNTVLVTEKHESEAKQNVTDGILDKTLLDITAGTTLKDSQNLEVLADTTRSDLESTSDIAVNSEQIVSSEATTIRDDAESSSRVILIDAQIEEMNEKTDLVIANTAVSYEQIKASQDKTVRDNLLNNSVITKTVEEIDLVKKDVLEVVASTTRQDAETVAKIQDLNYDIGIKVQQEFNLRDKNGDIVTQYEYYLDGVSGTTGFTFVLSEVVGTVVDTTTSFGNGTSLAELEKQMLFAKNDLVSAQTLGFASDTKQKVLKTMNDGWAVAFSIAEGGNIPEANQDKAIDLLSQKILEDVGINDMNISTYGNETVPGEPG